MLIFIHDVVELRGIKIINSVKSQRKISEVKINENFFFFRKSKESNKVNFGI